MKDTTVTLDFGEAWTGAAEATDTLVEAWASKPTINSTFGLDTARARRTDKPTSQRAADKSAETLTVIKKELLELVRRHKTLTGSQANTLYRELAMRSDGRLKIVAWDSPRKRLAELAKDKKLVAVNEDDPRGTETVYALPSDTKELAA